MDILLQLQPDRFDDPGMGVTDIQYGQARGKIEVSLPIGCLDVCPVAPGNGPQMLNFAPWRELSS